jgi:hypothetical protein
MAVAIGIRMNNNTAIIWKWISWIGKISLGQLIPIRYIVKSHCGLCKTKKNPSIKFAFTTVCTLFGVAPPFWEYGPISIQVRMNPPIMSC